MRQLLLRTRPARHFIHTAPLQPVVRCPPNEAATPHPTASRIEATERDAKRPLLLAEHDGASSPQRHVAGTDCDAQRRSCGRAPPFTECERMVIGTPFADVVG